MDNNPHKGVKPAQTQYNPGFSMGCPQKKREEILVFLGFLILLRRWDVFYELVCDSTLTQLI